MRTGTTDRLLGLYHRITGWLSSHERQAVTWYIWITVSLLAALSIHYILKANALL